MTMMMLKCRLSNNKCAYVCKSAWIHDIFKLVKNDLYFSSSSLPSIQPFIHSLLKTYSFAIMQMKRNWRNSWQFLIATDTIIHYGQLTWLTPISIRFCSILLSSIAVSLLLFITLIAVMYHHHSNHLNMVIL